MRELRLLDGQQEERPGPQIEGDLPVLLERPVPGDRLVEELVDPARRLAEEEAAVAPRGARADSTAVDDEDARAGLGERERSGAPGDAGADDDGVPSAYVSFDSVPPERRFRQKRSPPTAAPTAAAAATEPAMMPFLFLPGVTTSTFRRNARLANGFAAV
jgi:hypothetical protein